MKKQINIIPNGTLVVSSGKYKQQNYQSLEDPDLVMEIKSFFKSHAVGPSYKVMIVNGRSNSKGYTGNLRKGNFFSVKTDAVIPQTTETELREKGEAGFFLLKPVI